MNYYLYLFTTGFVIGLASLNLLAGDHWMAVWMFISATLLGLLAKGEMWRNKVEERVLNKDY